MRAVGNIARIAGLLLVLLSLGFLIMVGRWGLAHRLASVPPAPAETTPQATVTLEGLLGEDYVELLTDTITMQMENRMNRNPHVDYYPVSEKAPLGEYVTIGADTPFEVDTQGYLVVCLPAGTVADSGHGEQRFRIARVAEPETPENTQESAQSWELILVNFENLLPENYAVELTQLGNEQAVDARIAGDLQRMLADARAEGLSPVVCSSYRTGELQQTLYSNKVARLLKQGYSQEDAQTEAARWVARPGTSEHQLGLAVDIVAESYPVLDAGQEDTPEQQWLMANSYRYGFVLRYPEGKSYITGIGYEPWHYRYVGVEAAEQMYRDDLCLEEYLTGL